MPETLRKLYGPVVEIGTNDPDEIKDAVSDALSVEVAWGYRGYDSRRYAVIRESSLYLDITDAWAAAPKADAELPLVDLEAWADELPYTIHGTASSEAPDGTELTCEFNATKTGTPFQRGDRLLQEYDVK